MFEITSFVPRTNATVRAFRVPDNVSIDVLTDPYPAAQPGDYIQVDDNGTPTRAWTATEFEATFQPA